MDKLNPIKRARIVAGLRQVDLAKLMGVSTVAVSKWEKGITLPNVTRIKKLATVLNTTAEALIK